MGIFKTFVAFSFTLVVGSCVYSIATAPDKPPPTPEQVLEKTMRDLEFRQAVAGARALKANMKNPASFELVFAGMNDEKTMCYEYRGTNSFNAVVTNRYVIGEGVASGEPAAWNKHCAGQRLTDYTHARRAL